MMPIGMHVKNKIKNRNDKVDGFFTLLHSFIFFKITDMKILDDLNIEPGYAVIFRIDMDYYYIFAKSQLEANGFTVKEYIAPCEELEDMIVIRRINLPNLNKKAYIYLLWEDIEKGDVITLINDFCEAALNINDPRQGHLRFIREEEPDCGQRY